MAKAEELKFMITCDSKGAITGIRKVTDELDKTEKKTKKSSEGIAKSFKSLLVPIAAVAGAALTMKKAFDFAQEGAAIKRLEEAGTRLAQVNGQSFDAISKVIQQASGNTVSHLDAISQANIAMRLGVAQSPAEFEKLTKAAIALGRATGRTANESVADLTTGIGRQSKMILDNLGIVYQADKVYAAHAKTIGKVAKDLTDAEKKQALLNLALKAAEPLLDEQGNLIDDNASSYEAFGSAVENATNRMKEELDQALEPLIGALADYLNLKNAIAEAEEAYGIVYVSGVGYIQKGIGIVEENTEVWLAWAKVKDADAARWTGWAVKYKDFGDDLKKVAEGFTGITEGSEYVVPALENYTLGALAARIQSELFADYMKDGVLTSEEADRIREAGKAIGVELPDDMQNALDMAVTLTAEGLSPMDSKLSDVISGIDQWYAKDGKDISLYQTIYTRTVTGWEDDEDRIPRKRGGTATPSMLVGEAGPELIIGGQVIPTGPTKEMLAKGLVPGARFGLGGAIGAYAEDIIGWQPGGGGGIASDPYTDPDPIHDPEWRKQEAPDYRQSVYAALISDGGGGTAGGNGASAVVEAIIEEAVTGAVETASVVAAKASTEAKAASENQRMETMRGNTILEQIRGLIADQASLDEMRDILEETTETSGF